MGLRIGPLGNVLGVTEPIVQTVSGKVRGRIDGATSVFLGIPYAAPPFGPRRFDRPTPAEPWAGVREATDYGPTAPQPDRQFTLVPEPVRPGPECLNLNVFTPDIGDAGLPVLVWIHGGGFTAGCNASPWYHGGRFARDGIVVVAINYRLGAEGFLAIDGAPVNRAVRDWVAALEWVQENIARFGGDPAKVTIAGQSAGGVACAALLACPPAQSLFRSAICMSGSRMGWATAEGAAALTAAMADELGVPATREGLAAVDPEVVVAAQDPAVARLARDGQAIRLAFGPVVDGDIVVDDPYRRAGEIAGATPIMVGSTAEEFNAMQATVPGGVDEARLDRRLGRMGLNPVGIAAYRSAMPDAEPWRILGQAVTDSFFKAPAVRLADTWAAGGGSAYVYSFEWQSEVAGYGSVHCLDIPFAFDNLDASGVVEVTGSDPPLELATAVHSAWVRFITDGDAGWEPHDTARRPAMVFDSVSKVVDDPWRLARTTWLQQPV